MITKNATELAAIKARNQMELGLNSDGTIPRPGSGKSRAQRARWWFDRMRQVVDSALDWQPLPPPRPSQSWLPLSRNDGLPGRA